MILTPNQQKFVKAFQVKFPGQGEREAEMKNLTTLRSIVVKGSEEEMLVDAVFAAWVNNRPVTIESPPPTPTKVKSAPPVFDFTAFCAEQKVVPPDSQIWVDANEVQAQLTGIEALLKSLPRTEGFHRNRLIAWSKQYRVLRGRLQLQFGSDARRGPPAGYLAKKAAKRAKDQKIRSSMQSTKGQK